MNKQILKNTIFIGLFIVPFIPFLVSSAFFFPFITTKAFAWRILVEIIFAAWLILAMMDAEYRPKKSVILYSILTFLGIVFLADIFSVARGMSFWSNFERMEGFVALIHLGAFFLVIGSVFKEHDWKKWWNVSLVASFFMVLYAGAQLLGLATINQGGVRVDGTLGNAIYLAVYMLFHIFIALMFLFRERKNTTLRIVYGVLILSQITVLYYTATRGAILGLLGGLLIVAVLNIKNKEDQLMRRASISILVGLLVVIGGFFVFRNSAFVMNSPVLSRFTSLTSTVSSTQSLKNQGRYYTWPMALKGIKDKPLLGWGQENFSYVFQKYYSPEMFRLEPWFDRAHNVFLDWGVSAGLLGLIAYLSLYVAVLLSIRRATHLSYADKTILVGLVAAYFFHNFFVFDHLISYILFFSLLSYLHVHHQGETLWKNSVSEKVINTVAVPAVVVVLALTLYVVNYKPLTANTNLIEALISLQSPDGIKSSTSKFEKAYSSSSLGKQEVVEHLSNNIATILQSNLPMEDKNAFFTFAKNAVLNQAKVKENDARMQLVAGSFLSLVGMYDESLARLTHAEELMPGKQQIRFEIGSDYIGMKEPQKALQVFKEAYELAPEYEDAQVIYLLGGIYAGNRTVENEMLAKLPVKLVAFDDRIANAYYSNKRYQEVHALLTERIKLDPANAETYNKAIESLGK